MGRPHQRARNRAAHLLEAISVKRVQEYRDKAAALRDRAQATKDAAVREELVTIALAYEELARDIEADERTQP